MTEQKRGCGFRKVGGTYLVGDFIPVSCDKLPVPLKICPCCGSGIRANRGWTKINPVKLFGAHRYCADKHQPCYICQPQEYGEVGYLLRIGEKFYSVEEFLEEAKVQGISRRIAQIPRDFILGKTVVYLAHINACVEKEPTEIQTELKVNPTEVAPRLLEAKKIKRVMGIFTAFIPQRIEKIYWQNVLDEMPQSERKRLEKRGITPIGVPISDRQHE
jgi:hypothetical protein